MQATNMQAAMIVALLGISGSAAAATVETHESATTDAPPTVLVGARIGIVTPQVFNKLETNYLVDIEGAYQLPFANRALGVFLDLGFSQPHEHGTRTDPRVAANGGAEAYDMQVQDLGLALGLQYRLALGSITPYAGIAAKMHLTKTIVDQSAGTTDLGTNVEQSTRFGVLVRLGAALALGPGEAVFEAHVEYTGIDHTISGDANTGHLAFQLGYLLRL